jgi:hypothetical protein
MLFFRSTLNDNEVRVMLLDRSSSFVGLRTADHHYFFCTLLREGENN